MNPIPSDKKWVMRMIIVIHEIERLIYKTLYFYLFPYIVVFLSYSLYTFDAKDLVESAGGD